MLIKSMANVMMSTGFQSARRTVEVSMLFACRRWRQALRWLCQWDGSKTHCVSQHTGEPNLILVALCHVPAASP